MHEKRGVIDDKNTKPEEKGKPLEDHLTKRAADRFRDAIVADEVIPSQLIPENKTEDK